MPTGASCLITEHLLFSRLRAAAVEHSELVPFDDMRFGVEIQFLCNDWIPRNPTTIVPQVMELVLQGLVELLRATTAALELGAEGERHPLVAVAGHSAEQSPVEAVPKVVLLLVIDSEADDDWA